ncbi:MAG: tRNA (N(6)-L-threonylcarbamoyladenosine(37)-C(2))-methylthiotransferase MtaB [Proteobacteria bacterium]|nr:MAG: tRNA (N(6)-L-threonylcarbamoyladenosine(37)-C(2))-methylthiotransferase MtaB [Pseudomonadota bacterium]
MDVFLTALGCRLNEAELQSWSRDFRAAGHRLVSRAEEAQLVVLNTCAVTAEAARKSRKLANRLHRQNPNAQLVMTGCYAELEPEATGALGGVDLVINNHDKDWLLRVIERELELAEAQPPTLLPITTPSLSSDASTASAPGRTRAFVKVQDGCRNRCAFCIVTVARGEERSRPIDRIIEELSDLAARGYREVVLTGVHLGGYGADLGTDLGALVREVLARTTIERLRLSSIEPWDLTPGLFGLWREGARRLCPHLHLPLQSGSDAVLRRMARRCDTARYAELVASAREAIPDLTVTTDIIVGFPGETEEEWQETIAFCEKLDFAHMHIFSYSARHGTAAARMGQQVPTEVKRQRSRELHRLANESRARCLQRYVGSERSVLWEGAGEAVNGTSTRYGGLTDNYLRCEIVVPNTVVLENRLTPVTLSEIDIDTYRGEFSTATLAALTPQSALG